MRAHELPALACFNMQAQDEDQDAIADMLAVSRSHLRDNGQLEGQGTRKPSIEMKRMRKEEPSYARMPFRGSDINQGVQVSASSSLLWKPRTCVGSSYEPIRL